MNPDAVIFDMDGLLLDTERIALEMFAAACAELGVAWDEAVYLSCIGRNAAATERILRDGLGEKFPLAAVQRLWGENYTAATLGRPLPMKPGAGELVEFVAESGKPMAVATSTAHDLAAAKLANAGILGRFEFVVAGDQVARGKPDPEIYRTAVDRLGLEPRRCLALEDSDNGVRSALGAGLAVIQIPDLVPPSDEIRAHGHPVMTSLDDVARHLTEQLNRIV